MDEKIASFFYKNGIAFSDANLSSFAVLIEKSIKFGKHRTLQSHATLHCKKIAGELLDKAYASTEEMVAPLLASAGIFGATIPLDEPPKTNVCVYANSKMAANARDFKVLKKFAWDNVDVQARNEITAAKPSSLLLQRLCSAASAQHLLYYA
jgi:hypothetical protein